VDCSKPKQPTFGAVLLQRSMLREQIESSECSREAGMFNLLRVRKSLNQCSRLREALEGSAGDLATLSAAQREHLAACPECQEAADVFIMSRSIVQDAHSRAAEPGPWFAPRVMAAIAAREAELRGSLDAWAAVPRLAARLTWVSALALLLASTWLYESPRRAQTAANNSQGGIESLFDAGQSPGPDDVLPSLESGHD
jgi:hypothetical protein